jgi:hypothetical protein
LTAARRYRIEMHGESRWANRKGSNPVRRVDADEVVNELSRSYLLIALPSVTLFDLVTELRRDRYHELKVVGACVARRSPTDCQHGTGFSIILAAGATVPESPARGPAYLDLTGQARRAGERANLPGWRTMTRSARSPTGAAANWACGPGCLPCTVDETAWFARDDLRPFGLMCLRIAFGLMCLRIGWRMATRSFSSNTRHGPARFPGDRAASGTGQAPIARPTAPRPQREETPT